MDFDRLAATHRRELQAHCYRMLGSLSDADDAVQETLLKAWKAADSFEGRASERTWLYKIATNTCLDAIDKRKGKVLSSEVYAPANPADPLGEPHPLAEFIDPCPEALWTVTTRESVALAFIAALQKLPGLQRAVLLLRDVLDFSANETAEMLDKSSAAVESALERARSAAQRKPVSETNVELLKKYLAAWESKDTGALTALLRQDATLAMPPFAAWFSGRAHIEAFYRGMMPHLGEMKTQAIQVSGGPGYAVWARAPGEKTFSSSAITALCIRAGEIASVDSFLLPALFSQFGLPRTL